MKQHMLLPLGLIITLIGCASDNMPVRQCPQVAIVRALEKVEDHGHDATEDARLVGAGLMQKVEASCVYEDAGADVNFKLFMIAEKGPGLGGNKISFPYFISLVGPEDKIFGKEMMTAEFSFPEGVKTAEQFQQLHVFIPLSKDEDASGYRVLTGFQLTDSQAKTAKEREEKAQ